MWECYKARVQLIYLPPHTSHVLQPLDATVFSVLKRAYRRLVGYLNYLTDSSPLGKRKFLECYQVARKEALTASNIVGGWAATGLWPVRVSRPLQSPLLLENSNASQQLPLRPQNSLPTPKRATPSILKARRSIAAIETPKGAQDLKQALNTMGIARDTHVRNTRHLIRKITKGFDEKDYLLAVQEEKIKALEAKVDALRPRKRRKVQLSPNKKFASIKAIRRAQIEDGDVVDDVIEDQDEPESDSEASTVEEDCIVVAVRE